MTEVVEGAVDLPGGNLHYEVRGEGLPLVFAHAGIADSRMWEPQVEAFAGDYRVVRYDMRGFGQSGLPEGSFKRHEDLHALLDHLDVEQAALVGCSIGGQTVIDFTLAYPKRVRALALVCAGLTGFDFDQYDGPYLDEWDLIREAMRAGKAEEATELYTQLWIDGIGREGEVDPDVRALALAMNRPIVDKEIAGGGEGDAGDLPAADMLGEIDVPTLVVMSTYDPPDSQAISRTLAEGIPGAQAVTLEGGHLPNLEQPAAFNALLAGFLGGLD